MRLHSLPPDDAKPLPRRKPRTRRVLRTVQVLPTLMTAGNLVVGLLACAYMIDAGAHLADGEVGLAKAEALFAKAGWLIFIGMFLDGLDGRVARMTGTTSAFGAQLDSLADCVTFGVAPALVAKTLLGMAFPDLPTKLLFGCCLIYVLGAALRLARYNVESERLSRDGTAHVTNVFRGLPSPAAAGVLAALLLLRNEYAAPVVLHAVEWSVLIGTPLLGLLMISRMPFTHVMNRYFGNNRAGPLTVVVLILLLYLIVSHFVETVAGLFVLYAVSGPLLTLTHKMFGVPRVVDHEDQDEDVDDELRDRDDFDDVIADAEDDDAMRGISGDAAAPGPEGETGTEGVR